MTNINFINDDVLRFAESYSGEPFHALICDPPYHLTDVNTSGANGNFGKRSDLQRAPRVASRKAGFMNQQWDGGDLAFRPETWAAFMPLLHDGAFGLAFCGSRGWHRQAVAIEDAGFVIHPSIFLWAFGSGFPKATRIDTQIDGKHGKQGKGFVAAGDDGRKSEFYQDKNFRSDYGYKPQPNSDDAKKWVGHRYGLQALKPAVEPIILFQKPYAKRPAPFEQINTSGAGALNIDGTRIGTETVKTRAKEKGESFSSVGNGASSGGGGFNGCDETERNGRWASNLILAHLPDCNKSNCADACPVSSIGEDAARFFFQSDYLAERLEETEPVFYCPKASDDERNAGLSRYTGQPRLTMNDGIGGQPIRSIARKPNYHPTIKPLKLAAYLAKLLLPPDKYAPRRLFNPFSGSGSESIGAMRAGWDEIVAVEQSAEYIEIAKARFAYWQQIERTKQMILFPDW